MALITMDQARTQLRLPSSGSPAADDEYTVDVTMKMEQATALVLNHLKIDADGLADREWTDETDPADDITFAIVQAAILEVLSNLFTDRGDREKPTDGPLTNRVKRMLSMLRDPTLA